MNIQVILNQEKCDEALKDEASMSACLTLAAKTEKIDKVASNIILYLVNKIIREVNKEKTVSSM